MQHVSPSSEDPFIDCPHYHFVNELIGAPLPHDNTAQGAFDNRFRCVVGDPGAQFGGVHRCDYATSGAKGIPHFTDLFRYLLAHFEHVRWLSTVFVLVDNRDLTESSTPQETLSHWPTVEAWWKSRLAMYGPANELCDLIFVPISQTAGLHSVHPTWAGTFVLAPLTLVFPGVHFVLLDSDCVPVTRFEVADIWKEVSLIRHPCAECPQPIQPTNAGPPHEFTESAPKAPKIEGKDLQHTQVGQGVLLVTEHNAEINAGFIVEFGSQHEPPLDDARWNRISAATKADDKESLLLSEADRLEQLYWAKAQDFLATRKATKYMTPSECAVWVQSGLALTPFAGCSTHTSFDWTLAWSLIGEWTSRELFPPRSAHPRNLLNNYARRLPPILTWAHACFEQGSLPSMLHLPGQAQLFVLPGERMYQAQRILSEKARPVILHGYGGAKRAIPRNLPLIAKDGRVPLASGMVGCDTLPPQWMGNDLRPVLGTSIDLTMCPDPLTEREELLLLSLWKRVSRPCLAPMVAVRTWLFEKTDVPLYSGPDHLDSPHSIHRCADFKEIASTPCMQVVMNVVNLKLTPQEHLAVRIVAFSMSSSHLKLLNGLLLGGSIPYNFPHCAWKEAVQDYLDGKPLIEITGVQRFQDVLALLPPGQHRVLLITKDVIPLTDREVTSLRSNHSEGCSFPLDMFIVHEMPPTVALPKQFRVDCTGLGGHDLGGNTPWHTCLRTDRHGQSIYGPSVAAVEQSTMMGAIAPSTRWHLVSPKR